MKKTLIITLEYPPRIGGIASYIFNLCSHLPPEEVVVYAPKIKGGKEFDATRPWKTYRHNPYWVWIWPKWIRMYWQVRHIVKKEKIERIFVHHVLPVGYVAKLLKLPFTIFLHGTDLELGSKFKKEKLENVCLAAEKIVVNSKFLQDKLASRLERVDIKKTQIVYPCPADFFFDPVPAENLNKLKTQLALQGKKVILTVARFAEGKGYGRLARLLPQILQKVPNLVWLVVGDGPKRPYIMDQIAKSYLQNVVRYLGQLVHTELPQYYQIADLFVLLCHKDDNAEEGWGTVFLEAAAAGLPVVAGRVGGVEEVVKNLETGLVVDVHQDMSVVSAIADLLRETDYAKQMGATGRNRAISEFRWEKEVEKLK